LETDILSKFLQMSLAICFQQTSESYTIKVNGLVKDRPYPITRAERCETQYGPAVLLTIQESENSTKKFFLPRRYSDVMIDKDLENKFWKQKIWSSLYERVHR
jgi:hypothetical protein